jgi:hypothetical protein
MIKILSVLVLLLVISITIISCGPSGPDEGELPILSVEDISCTEVWIKPVVSGPDEQGNKIPGKKSKHKIL